MNHREAIEFLLEHAEWLKSNWNLTPEGREYEKKFLSAIDALK